MRTLYINCPFCNPEFKLRQRGEIQYFISAPGANYYFSIEELEAIKQFLDKERIEELIILQDDEKCVFKEYGQFKKTSFYIDGNGELKGEQKANVISILDFLKHTDLKISLQDNFIALKQTKEC